MNPEKQKSFQCDDCKLDFDSPLKLANHKYDVHLNSLVVYLENAIEPIIVNRCDSKFTCPECSSKLISPTTFRRHLKKHNAYCETTSKGKKRQNAETDNDSNSSSLPLKHQKIPVPHFNLEKQSSSSKSPLLSSSLCDSEISILKASNAIDLPESEQEKFLLLAKIGNWTPITISSENGKKYHMLTSQSVTERILADQPTGAWTVPNT